ncbi:hypothetical protein TNCV_371821 [Trichonephila clavipes]|nr:hypothetical protein TNCV_371821 [Trichonephila clavipes]
MITLLVKRLRDTGSVADRKRSGRAFIHNENESGRCGDRFTKTIEKTVRLHKHHYRIHILAESVHVLGKAVTPRCLSSPPVNCNINLMPIPGLDDRLRSREARY